MKRYATLKDVAELAGTTPATVSYVLNGSTKRYISDEMRERVLQAADELNYVKSGVASSLKGKQRGMIAVMVPQFDNMFFTKIVVAVEKIANRYGYVLLICNTFDDIEREKELLNQMMQLRVDGYVIIPTEDGTKNTEFIRKMGLPYVVVERPLVGIDDCDYVAANNLEAGYIATQQIVNNNHKNVGYVGWRTGIENLCDRFVGYKRALEEKKIVFDESLTVFGELTEESGYKLTQQLITSNPHITSICFGFHIQARGGMIYMRENGIAIPDDISVSLVGAPDWAQTYSPLITCVQLPDLDMGERAAELLFNRIFNNNRMKKNKQFILEGTLIGGNSIKQL